MSAFLLKNKPVTFLIALSLFLAVGVYYTAGLVLAAPNLQINYQGKLTNASNVAVADAGYQMEFSLYTASSSGTAIWTETRTGANEVTVQNGLFSVMLGSVTPLAGIDFNQTLYLGVTIEADAEMVPRKVLGAVPAAFEANNANTVGGVASTSLLRNDRIGVISTTSASTLLTIIQSGTGDILNLFDGGTNVFTVRDGGNVGIGTTTPGSKLTVAGDTYLGGNLTVSGAFSTAGTSTLATTTIASSTIGTLNLQNALGIVSGGTGFNSYATGDFIYASGLNTLAKRAVGTTGQILSVVGGVPDWVATSTLGFASAFTTSAQLAALLSDEVGSAGGGLAVFSNGPTFTGTTNFASTTASAGYFIGNTTAVTGSTTANTFYFAGASSTSFTAGGNYNYGFGAGALSYLSTGDGNFAVGNNALRGSSTALMTGTNNIAIGGNALLTNISGSSNLAMGLGALAANTSGQRNNALGAALVSNTTGLDNNALGFEALQSNTTGSFNNSFGQSSSYLNTTGSHNNTLGYQAALSNVSGLYNNTLGYQAAYSNQSTGTIAIGYRVADNALSVDRSIFIGYDIEAASTTADNVLNIGNLIFGTSLDGTGTTLSSGNIGIGTSSPSSKLTVAGSFIATGTSTLATTTITNLTLAQALAATSGGTGLSTIAQNELLIGGAGNTWSQVATSSLGLSAAFTTSAQLAALLSDEVGSAGGGLAVFSNGPTFTGTTTFSGAANFGSLVTLTGSAANIALGANYLSGDGGDEGLSVDSLGYVGIANNAPAYQLEVNDFGTAVSGLGTPVAAFADDTNSISGIYMRNKSTGASADFRFAIADSGDHYIAFSVPGVNAASTLFGAVRNTSDFIFNNGGTARNLTLGTFEANDLIFGTNNVERVRILSTGNVGIGSTSPSAKLTVSGAGFFGGNLTATGTLAIFGTSTLATTTITNLTLAQALGATSGGTGLSTITQNQILIGGAGNTWSQVATSSLGLSAAFASSSQLAAILTDETGSGSVVFSNAPTFSGTVVFPSQIQMSGTFFARSGNHNLTLTSTATTNVTLPTTGTLYGTAASSFSSANLLGSLSDKTGTGTAVFSIAPTFTGLTSFASTTNSANLTVLGTSTLATTTITDLALAGAFRDTTNSAGTNGMVLQSTGTSTRWVATSTLGFSGGGSSLFTDGGATTYLTSSTDNLSVGTTTSLGLLTVATSSANAALAIRQDGTGDLLDIFDGATNVFTIVDGGNVGIGTTSPLARLSMQKTAMTGTQTAGIDQYFGITNSTLNAVLFGNNTYIDAAPSATSTIAGSIIKIADNTTLGNNVQGLQVQTNRGSNTRGENTAIAGFGRTFGIRGTTEGDAGALFEPAGVFAETRGTTLGNALRAYSDSITTTDLVSFDQDSSAFSGNGLTMDFGTGGSFTGNFMKLRNGGVDRLTIDSLGGIISSSTLAILGTSTLATTTVRDLTLAGAFRDTTNSAGTNGMVLQTNGTSTRWVATSTLGFSGGGATTFLALTDTPGSYTANRIMFSNSGATALTDSANFTFDGTDLGLGANSAIALGGISVFRASTTLDNFAVGRATGNIALGSNNVMFGGEAGSSIQSGNISNSYFGHSSGFRMQGSGNVALGTSAGYGLSGEFSASNVIAIGREAGFNIRNGSDESIIIGAYAAGDVAAAGNIVLGYSAASNLTTGARNIAIGYDIDFASTTRSNQLNIGNLIFGTGIDGTGTTLSSGNIGIGSTSPSSKLTVAGAGFFGGNLTATGTLAISGTSTLATTTVIGSLTAGGEIASASGISFRLMQNNYGSLLASDGTNFYLLFTNSGDQLGGFNSLRPLTVSVSTGAVSMQHGLSMTGTASNVNLGTNYLSGDGDDEGIYIDSNGQVGIGTSTPGSRLTVAGNTFIGGNLTATGTLAISGTSTLATTTIASSTITTLNLINALAGTSGGTGFNSYATGDFIYASGVNTLAKRTIGTTGQVLQVVGGVPAWVATSSLGITSSLFTDGGASTYLTSVGDNLAIGTTSASEKLTVNGNINLLGGNAYIKWNGDRVLFASTSRNNYTFGFGAGEVLTTGSSNVAIGGNALFNATSSGGNIAIGKDAGLFTTSGSDNVFIGGAFTGYSNTTGGDNIFIGYAAGGNNTTGGSNVFVGNSSGNGLVSGGSNSFYGLYSGLNLATSSNSVIIGFDAGNGSGGSYQASGLTLLGRQAGFNLQTGADNNILIGYNAANSLTTGANNLIIGYDVEAPSNTANNQLNIGNLIFGTGIDGTGTTLSTGNIGIGSTSPSAKLTVAGTFTTTGTSTLATTTVSDLTIARALRDTTGVAGTNGMVLQTTGTSTRWVATSTLGISGGASLFTDGGATSYLTSLTDNLAIGSTSAGTNRLSVAGNINIDSGSSGLSILSNRVLYASSTNDSVLLGIGAGQSLNGSSIGNTAVGNAALQLSTSSVYNTAIGYAALNSNTEGNYNTAVGASALISNTTGISNSAFGLNSMRLNLDGSFNTAFGNGTLFENTDGVSNTAIGYNTLSANTIGTNNVAVGQDALNLNASGTQNTAIGMSAGIDLINNEFEGRNTLIGYNTGNGITTGINNTIIGANVTGLSATLSNNIIIADGLGNQRINVGATGNVGIGSTSPSAKLAVAGTLLVTGTSTLATTSITGLLQMGTTSVASRFNLDVNNFATAGTAGLNRFYTSTNAASGTVQFGELAYNKLSTTATTTYVGSMFRVEDSTTFGNTVRGLEVQTNRGTNTRGENTALSGFARTFGVRGYTSADAGGVFEPAGGYFETGGTTQGNAIRGYSSTITTAGLMSLFQDTSAFSGNGLIMNLGNGTGSFTGKFMDLQVAGATRFNVASTGTLFTLGDISITATNTDPADNNVVGIYLGASGFASINRAANPAMSLGRTTDGAVLEFYSAGTVQGSVSIAGATVSYNAFTGSHFGLTGSTTYSMGTVLALTGENESYNDIAASEILYGMTQSTEENSPLVIGSYLSVLEPTLAESAANPTLVMAVGNGAMWVADQGENITRGDYLISSNVAGHAERDPQTAEVSNIIARASEDINWSEVTTEINGVKHKRITVFFETFTRSNINLALIASSTVELASIDEDSVTGNFMTGLFSKLTQWFGSAQNGIGSMYANVFNANERICVDGECLTADDIRDLKDALQNGGSTNPPAQAAGGGETSNGEGSGTGSGSGASESPTEPPTESGGGGSETTPPPVETPPEPTLEPEPEPTPEPEPEPEAPVETPSEPIIEPTP